MSGKPQATGSGSARNKVMKGRGKRGRGTVERNDKWTKPFRARTPRNCPFNPRQSLGRYATLEEARQALDKYVEKVEALEDAAWMEREHDSLPMVVGAKRNHRQLRSFLKPLGFKTSFTGSTVGGILCVLEKFESLVGMTREEFMAENFSSYNLRSMPDLSREHINKLVELVPYSNNLLDFVTDRVRTAWTQKQLPALELEHVAKFVTMEEYAKFMDGNQWIVIDVYNDDEDKCAADVRTAADVRIAADVRTFMANVRAYYSKFIREKQHDLGVPITTDSGGWIKAPLPTLSGIWSVSNPAIYLKCVGLYARWFLNHGRCYVSEGFLNYPKTFFCDAELSSSSRIRATVACFAQLMNIYPTKLSSKPYPKKGIMHIDANLSRVRSTRVRDGAFPPILQMVMCHTDHLAIGESQIYLATATASTATATATASTPYVRSLVGVENPPEFADHANTKGFREDDVKTTENLVDVRAGQLLMFRGEETPHYFAQGRSHRHADYPTFTPILIWGRGSQSAADVNLSLNTGKPPNRWAHTLTGNYMGNQSLLMHRNSYPTYISPPFFTQLQSCLLSGMSVQKKADGQVVCDENKLLCWLRLYNDHLPEIMDGKVPVDWLSEFEQWTGACNHKLKRKMM